MTHFISRMIRNPRHIAISALATLAIAAAAITPAIAGDKHRHDMDNMTEQERLEHMEDRLDKRMARLTKALTLSDDQARRVRDILSTSHTERLDIKARHKEDRKAAKPELKDLKARTQDDLKRVLTTAQFEQLETMQAERHAKKMERRKGKHGERGERGAKRLERLEKELSLSEQQVTQIKALHADRKVQAKALIDQAGSREAAKPELKALRKATHEEVRALLTPDQQQKFDAMKKEHRKDRRQK